MSPIKIVVAPQALKGSLEAPEVGSIIAGVLSDALPTAEIIVIPVADGGEGTARALISATGGQALSATVTGPLGAPVRAEWGILGGDGAPSAVIEMAAAAGITLIHPDQRDPLLATTRGVGELILHALDAGCHDIILGLGGSATNDGGAGLAQALGARLLDGKGRELESGGAGLARLARIETAGMDARVAGARIRAACDVTNPLCGALGASAIYGPQKGADAAIVTQLDDALLHYARIIERDLGRDVATTPGAGAAGGLGAGLLAFTPAQLISGATLILEALRFEQRARDAALVIVAEGRLDEMTRYGKITGRVAHCARSVGARTLAIVGEVALNDNQLAELEIDAALALAPGPLNLEESMAGARDLLAAATRRALRLMRLGEALGARDWSPQPPSAGSA